MKLFARYTRLNLAAMLTVFIIGIGTLFFIFRYILIRQVDEVLDIERDEILQHVQRYGKLPPPVAMSDLQIQYRPAAGPGRAAYFTIKGVGEEGKPEDFRQLRFPLLFNGGRLQVLVTTSLEHTQGLLKIIGGVTLAALLLMLASIYAINRGLIKHLLKPFYNTLQSVRSYSIAQQSPLQLPPTAIEEFTTLNHTLNEMAERGQKDYSLMRDFTAQAAHELQTPLAVLSTKLEALMQSPGIGEGEAAQIEAINDSVERLTRLFHSLLLLTKIRHQGYAMNEVLAIDRIIAEKAEELSDIITARNIRLVSALTTLNITCNRHLAEALIGNLLSNAIRYNYDGGQIELTIEGQKLSVSNTSQLPQIDEATLFRPFYRHPDSKAEGNGLGLSIVAQICEACGFAIRYRFHSGTHVFEVAF